MMNLLDLKLGSLKSLGPVQNKPHLTGLCTAVVLFHMGIDSPVYSGAGKVPLEPVSHSLSALGFASLLGVTHAGEFGRL